MNDIVDHKPEKRKQQGGAPPTVLSEEEISLVQVLASTLNQIQIAKYFGIGQTTWYEIKKRQPEVDIAFNKGKMKAIDDIGNSLIKTALSESSQATQAAIFYLRTQAGWRDKSDAETEDNEDYQGPTPLLVKFEDPKDNMKEVKEVKDERTK